MSEKDQLSRWSRGTWFEADLSVEFCYIMWNLLSSGGNFEVETSKGWRDLQLTMFLSLEIVN